MVCYIAAKTLLVQSMSMPTSGSAVDVNDHFSSVCRLMTTLKLRVVHQLLAVTIDR
jgi:hypothetical protein